MTEPTPRTGRRRERGRWAGVIGMLAIAVIALIGWIAYRANLGLPLQSRYIVYADVPDADRLITAADVRIGGVLAGEVLSDTAERGEDGTPPYARLKLALDSSVGPLPADSTVQVRPASVLGLTYVELRIGRSHTKVRAGGTLPLSTAKPSYDLTDLFTVFDRTAQHRFQRALSGLAYGFAGRGSALNVTLGSLSRLLPAAQNVFGDLAAPSSNLSGFLRGYESTVRALAPVAGVFGELFTGGASTFGAVSKARPALGAALDALPGAEDSATRALTVAQPALRGLGTLAVNLRAAGARLPATLRQINTTLQAGVPTLRLLPGFSAPLGDALQTLEGFARDPYTSDALRKLHDLVVPTNQVLSTFEPAQVYCDVLGQWGVDFSSTFGGQGDGVGPSLPNLVISGAGAIGEELQNPKPSANLATNPLPNELPGDCESGNETWSGHQQLNNLPAFHSTANRWTNPPPGVMALAARAGLLKPIAGPQ